MCGITGAISTKNIVPMLLSSLKKLAYRGYDSAGIAVINSDQQLKRVRALGKIENLKHALEKSPLTGHIGLAHTRWATHGTPHVKNAHPHFAGNQIALVHNGIIENYKLLKSELINQGCVFESETDTELIAHLIHQNLASGQPFLEATHRALKVLQGMYALGILCTDQPNRLIAVRSGSPLIIGIAEEGNFISSDIHALLSITKKFIYLEDGDIADIYLNKIDIYDANLALVNRPIQHYSAHEHGISKGKYKHFMLKEIHEQPTAINATLAGRVNKDRAFPEMFGENAPQMFKKVRRIKMVACGSSYYAGLIASYWIQQLAHIPCEVEIASENRYRYQIVEPNTLFIVISQSGETADTLAALHLAKKAKYLATLCITNVPESSIARESDFVFITDAGIEIGVASTKAFITQLTALLLLAIVLAEIHNKENHEAKVILQQFLLIPNIINQILKNEAKYKNLANLVSQYKNVLFIARDILFPIALEGSLKLKETSYIHAESYPAGELKHGPIALIDNSMLVVVLAPFGKLFNKLQSSMEEIIARHGKLIVLTDGEIDLNVLKTLNLPTVNPMLTPFIYLIPLQLLAYYVALLKGHDVDQPRNLAKSVTVE